MKDTLIRKIYMGEYVGEDIEIMKHKEGTIASENLKSQQDKLLKFVDPEMKNKFICALEDWKGTWYNFVEEEMYCQFVKGAKFGYQMHNLFDESDIEGSYEDE